MWCRTSCPAQTVATTLPAPVARAFWALQVHASTNLFRQRTTLWIWTSLNVLSKCSTELGFWRSFLLSRLQEHCALLALAWCMWLLTALKAEDVVVPASHGQLSFRENDRHSTIRTRTPSHGTLIVDKILNDCILVLNDIHLLLHVSTIHLLVDVE